MCSTVNLRLKGLKAQRFKGSSSLMFTWYIYLEAEPYERNVEEVACSPSIGFLLSRIKSELLDDNFSQG